MYGEIEDSTDSGYNIAGVFLMLPFKCTFDQIGGN